MANVGKGYYEDFYFSFIEHQYKYYKNVLAHPENCVYKDVGLPSEIVFGAGLTPAIIEMTATLLPAAKLRDEVIAKGDRCFFDSGMCSFNRVALPALESGALALPKAFVCLTVCQEAARNFSMLSSRFQREYLPIDVPYGASKEAAKYVAEQLEQVAHSLCSIAGVAFDIDRLREVLKRSNRASEYLHAGNQLRRTRPAAFFGGPMLKFMNIRWFLGTDDAIRIAKAYFDAGTEARRSGKSRLDERFRVLWCNLGMMYDTQFFEYMERTLGAVIAFEEMSYVPEEPMDEREPFVALARRILDTPFIADARRRSEFLIRLVKDFNVDGVIAFLHVNCRMFNSKLRLVKEALRRENIPMLELSGDCLDSRTYNRAQLMTRVEAFVEMLESK